MVIDICANMMYAVCVAYLVAMNVQGLGPG